MTLPCPVCRADGPHTILDVPELHIGTGELFRYLQCSACGALSLLDVPADLGAYYPAGYYAFEAAEPVVDGALKRWLKERRTDYALSGRGLIGRLAESRYRIREPLLWLKGLGLRRASRILDVGCGTGGTLLALEQLGMSSLSGADPFIEADLDYGAVKVFKAHLDELSGRYDLIMLHHSFEHMPEHDAALRKLRELLAPGGWILIRTPVAGGVAHEEYGPLWVQIDAPRHLTVHNERSLRLCAQAAGLAVERVVYDSTAFQFWGSEQYRRGITLNSPQSWHREQLDSPFSADQVETWELQAQQLNAEGRGDQAAFYLRVVA